MSASVSYVLDEDVRYDTHLPPWRAHDGVRQTLHFEGRNWRFTTIQGTADQFRALAVACTEAAGQADAWAAAHPDVETES